MQLQKLQVFREVLSAVGEFIAWKIWASLVRINVKNQANRESYELWQSSVVHCDGSCILCEYFSIEEGNPLILHFIHTGFAPEHLPVSEGWFSTLCSVYTELPVLWNTLIFTLCLYGTHTKEPAKKFDQWRNKPEITCTGQVYLLQETGRCAIWSFL